MTWWHYVLIVAVYWIIFLGYHSQVRKQFPQDEPKGSNFVLSLLWPIRMLIRLGTRLAQI